MTPETVGIIKAEIKTFMGLVESGKALDNLFALQSRWLDEREYEDFDEYVEVMKKHVPEGYEFVKANKSPFGYTVKCKLGHKLQVKVATTGRWFVKYVA